MMTNFSENVLGIYYRRRNSQGEWSGGAMYYLKDGLGGRKHCKTIGSVLAVLFSILPFWHPSASAIWGRSIRSS